MNTIKIIKDKCVGCGLCISSCPFGAMVLDNKQAKVLEQCTLCGSCVSRCKFSAIVLEREKNLYKDCSQYKGVWIFGEQKNGKLLSVVYELIGQGRKLAEQLNTKVSVIMLGEETSKVTRELFAYGADEVYIVEAKELNYFHDELYSKLIIQLIEEYKPEIFLIGATTNGRSLAPRISSSLNTGLTADCTELEIDMKDRNLLQTRPAFGGNLMATIVCPHHRPQMATVRPKVMKALKPDYEREGVIIKPQIQIPQALKSSILEVIDMLKDEEDICNADIVVAAGRGVGEAGNLKYIKELAEALGGQVAASRAVVECGWIEYSRQVGQTGKTISPKIYIACGISGAIQHLVGISGADKIIAINKDSEAPIFKVANYCLVGDLLEIVPEIIRAFKFKTDKTLEILG